MNAIKQTNEQEE